MSLRSRALEKLAVVCLCTLAAWILTWRHGFWTPDNPLFWRPYDHWAYIYMAGHPFERFGMAPFCWRVLAPWTIGLLDAGEKANYFQGAFWWLAFGGVVVAGVASYGIGKRWFGTRQAGALLCCWFWSFYWATKAPLGNFVYLDGATYGLTALLVYLILARRDLLFVIALALGVALKESALFCWPLVYTLRATRPSLEIPLLRRTLVMALPALCVLVSLRVSIPARNHDAAYRATLPVLVRQSPIIQIPYSYPLLWKRVGQERLKTLSPAKVWSWTGGTFGFAAVGFVLLGVVLHPQIALRWLPFVLLCYAQLAFAVNDERLLIIAFPAVLALAGAVTHSLANKLRAPLWSFTLLPLGLFAQNALTLYPPSLKWQIILLLLLLVPFGGRKRRNGSRFLNAPVLPK